MSLVKQSRNTWRIKKQDRLEMEYHLRRLYPTAEASGFYALFYNQSTPRLQ
jgi:hypothetical protein